MVALWPRACGSWQTGTRFASGTRSSFSLPNRLPRSSSFPALCGLSSAGAAGCQSPRAALRQQEAVPVRDPRLSPAGNRLARRLSLLLDVLARQETWQRHPGLAELKRDDRRLLTPGVRRLAFAARTVANQIDDLWPQDAEGEAA